MAPLGLSCNTPAFLVQHVGSSSVIRDQTQIPCIGNTVLDTGSPGKSHILLFFLIAHMLSSLMFFAYIIIPHL